MLNENLSEMEKCSSPLIFLYQQVLHRQDYLDASDVTYVWEMSPGSRTRHG